MFKNLNILVLGFARSGYEVSKLLIKHNNKITINDYSGIEKQDLNKVKELEDQGIKFIFGHHPDDLLDNDFDLIVKNPGINDNNVVIKKAKAKNIPITTELDVAYTFLNSTNKVVAVTGSNGKTTTCEIIYQSLKKANKDVVLVGNIGIPISGIIDQISKETIIVLEVSAQQLNNIKYLKPNIIVFTNLSEAHLDFFGTYDNYISTKLKIYNNNNNLTFNVLNSDDEHLVSKTNNLLGERKYISVINKSDAYLELDNLILGDYKLSTNDILIRGNHNYSNILMAMLVLNKLGVNLDYLKSFLTEFKGYPHRLEYITKINNRLFFNDSKATNIKATQMALGAFDKCILLLGGEEREQNFSELLPYLNNTRLIVTFGAVSKRAFIYLKEHGLNVIQSDLLKDATRVAFDSSKEEETILLSPGSGSWDCYKDFEERGNEFKEVVLKIGEEYEN